MSFTVTRREGKARRGALRSSDGKSCATPACLLFTRKGSPQNLPVDLAASLVPALEAVYLPAGDVSDQCAALERSQRSMNQYFGLGAAMTFVGVRDPAAFNEASFAGTMAVAVTGGYAKLTAQQYATLLRVSGADFGVGPSYELPPTASAKRMKKCLESAVRWHTELLEVGPELSERLFAPILVQAPPRERRVLLDAMVAAAPLGYALCGLALGETAAQRQTWLAECLSMIPDPAPRLGLGVSSPDDIVEAVEAGLDLFTSVYPNEMAELGFALCFDLNPTSSPNTHPNKMNMRNYEYALDATPLVAGCGCYTCTQHTRAYLHHLLHTHEMLATILLMLHNCSHYAALFAAIRAHLDAGTFAVFAHAFVTRFRTVET